MDSTFLLQRLKGPFIVAVALLLAIFFGLQVANGSHILLVFAAGIAFAGCLVLFADRLFWVITIASCFLGGTFPILGGAFSPFQVLTFLGVAKFIIDDVILRRTRIRALHGKDMLLISGFLGIILLHGLRDRFGMKFLGSSVWGGHSYVDVLTGLTAFIVIQSGRTKETDWTKLPYAILAVTGFDLAIAIVTTIFPSSIYRIYPFYSAVSSAGIAELLGGGVETARLGAFGTFGLMLIIFVFATSTIPELFTRPSARRAFLLVCGTLGVLFSSFRSNVFYTVSSTSIAAVRDFKARVLLFLPLVAALLLGLSVINSEVVRLPKQMQRSLAFLPGDWDTDMKRDALSSNDFRGRLWTIWRRDFFPHHPFIGRGFGFSIDWAEPSNYHPGEAFDYQQMVAVGNIHNGLFACLDTFGILGTIFFVAWNFRLLIRTFQVPVARDKLDRTVSFLALYLGGAIICYWTGAPNVGTFLPKEFALAGVFLHLERLRRLRLAAPEPVSAVQVSERETLAAVPHLVN